MLFYSSRAMRYAQFARVPMGNPNLKRDTIHREREKENKQMEKGLLLCPKQCLSHVELYEVSPSSAQKPFFPLADRPTADYLFFSLSLPLSDLVWSLTSILAL